MFCFFNYFVGSEVTLVAGSDTSEDSMDSLDNQKLQKIPSFMITEPSENQPSITKGIGRKISSENDNNKQTTNATTTTTTSSTVPPPPATTATTTEMEMHEEFFLRRNSDKSSCYSDDSLSNDSLSIGNQSPSSSSNTQSSHAMYDNEIRNRQIDNYDKIQINREIYNSGTGNYEIFQNLNLTLESNDCGQPRFLVHCESNTNFPIKQQQQHHLQQQQQHYHQQQQQQHQQNVLIEPNHFENAHKNSVTGSYEFQLSDTCSKLESTHILELVRKSINSQVSPKLCLLKSDTDETSDKLSLEYEGGIQIELRIIDDKEKESKGLKMRRVSGDYIVYNQLCQQLISCMTVS